ncbi:Regulator of competence-specific genes [Variovorax sp. SRS16]|uniref:TfoX/Sxy family protein n=1 Tax=Variovorax sp. SRS16 TaxID=282217 RepID=UPI00131656A4|nr:TfoX/Sxy family protein [Variovorax sp. SRS16]VTU13939.1 Regulator of competence-specific genes [Variovorax sp. SRS16]
MNEFVDQLHDVFERFGRVSMRRMFGGYGVYHEGRMFGLVTGDRLYLKADAHSVAAFEAKQLAPFEYMRQGKPTRLSYYEAPPEVFEDRDTAAVWARRAWEAVLRAPPPKRKSRATRKA